MTAVGAPATAAGETAATAPARDRAWPGRLAAAALLAVHLASFDIARLPIVTDVRLYLYFAWRVTEGDVPHRDFFDHKTQLATFVGAALLRLGEALGVDPLVAIRAGFLALTALAGLLLHEVVRRLSGSAVAAILAVVAFTSFGLLGHLPALGPLPKLAAVTCATGAALAAHRGRWGIAGALGALAGLDWQVGGLALVGVGLAALASGPPREPGRGRALGRLALGAALVGVVALAYFAAHGAVGDFLAQTVGGSLDRSAATQARDTFGSRLARIRELVALDCPGRAWLAWASLAGLPVALARILRDRDARALLIPLVTFHGGLVLFSLYDFQLHADLYVLLHGLALFQALLWTALWSAVAARVRAIGPRRLAAAGVVALALAVARPGPLRPALAITTPLVGPEATLADQREVAAEVARRHGSDVLALVESSELLWLLRRESPLPVVFWNDAAWRHLRMGDETKDATLRRVLGGAGAGVWAAPRPIALGDGPPAIERIPSSSGQYSVILQSR